MKQPIKFLMMFSVIAGLTFYACSDDEGGGGALTLVSLTSGTTDLNGAASATGVAVDEPIIATFSKNVDEATTSGITLTRAYDDTQVAVTIDVVDKVVTIIPDADLSGGAQFILSIAGLKSTSGDVLATLNRNFTTGGTFVPDGVVAHWTFENNANDVVGAFDPAGANVVDVTYADSRNTAAGKAASFNGTTSIIEVPNGDQLLGGEFTISFWMWLDSAAMQSNGTSQKGHFVLGVANFNGLQFEVNDHEEWMKFATMYKRQYVNGSAVTVTDTVGTDFFFNADGTTLAATGREISTTVDKDYGKVGIRSLIGKKWVNVTFTLNGANKLLSLYLNGELVHEQDYSLFIGSGDAGVEPFGGIQRFAIKDSKQDPGEPDYYDNTFNFGFWQSRAATYAAGWGGCCHYQSVDAGHFKGFLDDIRFFDRAISSEEVTLMYNSEKP